MKFRVIWLVALVAMACSFSVTPLHAQTSFGSIVGVVSDTSQAVVPGVAITVTNTKTNTVRQAVSDSMGSYRVESILPGIYSVKAEKAGFQVTESTNVEVQVAATTTINIVMPVGTVTQTVEVVGAAPLLQTAAATIGTVVNNTSVVTLPLNGRNFTELISLIPGAVSSGGATFQIAGGSNYSVSGNRAEQNNFTLDGAYNNEEMFKTYGIQPSIDAIQEFKIQTNITSAEYGQAAGSNVNVATKSGTNAIHGTAFEFLRNNKLDANDWFSDLTCDNNNATNHTNVPCEAPKYQRNIYGGTIGGPLVIPHLYNGRDKTFWFFNYEANKVRQGSSVVGLLPTAAELGGDFTGFKDKAGNPIHIYDPATTVDTGTKNAAGAEIFARQPFSFNGQADVIDPARLDPWIKNYMNVFYPKINAAAGTNHIQTINNAPFEQNSYQWTGRGDQKIRENLNMFARMSLQNSTQTSVQSLPGLTSPLLNKFRNFVASWTLIANPTTVIDWKVAYNRTNIQANTNSPAPGWPAFLAANPISGTPIKNAKLPYFPQLYDDTGLISAPSQQSYPFVENEYQIMGSLSKIWGKHSIKAGMEFMDFRSLDDGNFTSIFHFNALATADPQNTSASGNGLASMLLGLPTQGLRNLGETEFYARQTRWQPYIQDDIKLTRKLTVNIGLRYEYNQWPVDRWDRIGGFDPTSGVKSAATPNGGAYLWAGHNAILNQGPNVRRAIRDPDFNNFAPRLGMAYQITPTTTFRGGYGIFYTSNYMWEDQGERGNWPYAVSQTLSSINDQNQGLTTSNAGSGVNTPVGLVPITNFFTPAVAPGPDSPETSQHVLGRTDRTTYVQQWNMGVQKMLTNSLMLEVDYLGNHLVKGSLFTNLNTALPGPGKIGVDKHLFYGDQWGAMSLMNDQASASYNSLEVKVEKRFSNGLQFLNSYAWGHQIDIGGSCFSCSSAPQDPFNWGADRADGTFDHRHIWTFSYFYQLPFGKGRKFMTNSGGVVNAVLGGWETSGIMHYQTGSPINVGYPGDIANIAPRSGGQRPNWVGGQPRQVLQADRRLGWVNEANYAPPNAYSFGNAGRNLEKNPGMGYFNPALLKNWNAYGEKLTVQFRAEAFNFLNQHAMGGIQSSFSAVDFGQAYGTQQGSREIQFGLKVLF